MIEKEKLKRFIKNNEQLVRMADKQYQPDEAKRLLLALAKELLYTQEQLEAYQELRAARKAGKQPSQASWDKWNAAKRHLEKSDLVWFTEPDPNEARLFKISDEINSNNKDLLK